MPSNGHLVDGRILVSPLVFWREAKALAAAILLDPCIMNYRY